MPSLLPTSTEIATTVDNWVRRFGADPLSALKSFDLKTVGLVGAGVVLVVLLFEFLGYIYAVFKGNSRSYVPYSRKFFDLATDAWDNRSSNVIGEYFDPYSRSR